MRFLHGIAIGNDGEELIQLSLLNGKFRVRIGGRFIGEYETEEMAMDVKKTINDALISAYIADTISTVA